MKTYTRNDIDNILRSNDRAVERAMVVLFNRQTQDEQQSADTNHHNGRGFCSCDARAGTRFARFIQGMDDKNQVRFPRKGLAHPVAKKIFSRYCPGSENPIDRARRIALKHSTQLAEEANDRLAA